MATIRPATPDDCPAIADLIRELAAYERLEHKVEITAGDLRRDLFGERVYAEALIAEHRGEPIGFALFFMTYSTFRGRPGIYLEDLYVKPAHRGQGIGKNFLRLIAKGAERRGCARVEWSVLNWNEPSIGFYKSLGARPMDEWTVYRLDDHALANLAASDVT